LGWSAVDTGEVIRSAVSGVGRVLVTLGVILLLFVGYQLWGTGITTARAQDDLARQLGEQFSDVPSALLSGDVASVIPETPADTVVVEPAELPAQTPESTIPSTSVAVSPTSSPVAPTTKLAAPTTTRFTTELVSRKTSKQIPIKPGEAIGQLVIPRISVNKAVVEGTTVEALKKGPGHYKSTPFPGEAGNAALACHRTTFGAPCFRLDELQAGDPIFVARRDKTGQAQWFKYTVTEKKIVKPTQNDVLLPRKDRNTLTLTTCHPKYSAKQRLIVTADLVGQAAESDLESVDQDPLAEQYKAQLDAKNGVTTTGPTTIAPATTTPETTTPESATADTSVPGQPVTTAIAPTDVAESEEDAPLVEEPTLPDGSNAAAAPNPDALSFGGERTTGRTYKLWFFEGGSDPWFRSLLWAAVCGVIWLVAWLLARHRRKMLVRWAIYGVSFLVVFLPALYMCFEQVSRLLPEAV
jgi:LPXTG-site transpeptidase (sortase) family protein